MQLHNLIFEKILNYADAFSMQANHEEFEKIIMFLKSNLNKFASKKSVPTFIWFCQK